MHTVKHPAHTRRKTKPRGCHPDKALSAPFLRSAPPGRHADGNGLYLFVQPSGTRSWIQRLVVRGRRRELGLGSVRLVSLAEAREKALANRKLAREGGDPLAEKRRAARVPIQFPGLGGRGNGPSPRGDRGGPGACGPEQGRGGLCALGPVRAPAPAHGRLGRLPGRPELRAAGRSSARRPCEAGAAGPVPQRVVKGSQPTQCHTLALARGSGPFEPPTGESAPLAPPSPPPLPSPSPMTEPSMAREATATRVCGPVG